MQHSHHFLGVTRLIDVFTTWLGEAMWRVIGQLGQITKLLAEMDRSLLVPLGIATVVVVGVPLHLMRGWLRSAGNIRSDVKQAQNKLQDAKLNLVIGDRKTGLGWLMLPLIGMALFALVSLLIYGYQSHQEPQHYFWQEGYK